jgi:hypothetical protein
MNGCHCPCCGTHLPHQPVDATMIARALRHDPPIFGAAKRILVSYDAQRRIPETGGETRQPWTPRPARSNRTLAPSS